MQVPFVEPLAHCELSVLLFRPMAFSCIVPTSCASLTKYNSDFQNAWIITTTVPLRLHCTILSRGECMELSVFMAWCLAKHGHIFAFTLSVVELKWDLYPKANVRLDTKLYSMKMLVICMGNVMKEYRLSS